MSAHARVDIGGSNMKKFFLLSAALAALSITAAKADVIDPTGVIDPLHGGCVAAGCNDNGTFTPTQNFTNVGFTASPAPQTGTELLVELVPTALQGQFGLGTWSGTGLAATAPTLVGEFTSGDLATFLGISMTSPANPFGGFQVGLDSSVTSFSVYTVNAGTQTLNGAGQPLNDIFSEMGNIPAGADLVAFLENSSNGGKNVATALSGQLQLQTTIGGSAPEPATWAMMLLGFGAMGLFAYRRRSAGGLRIA
jgi:hypothetical protein